MRIKLGVIFKGIGLIICAALWGCSVPMLEPEVCTEARPFVREFYSFHFANEMEFSSEVLEERERFLSRRFFEQLKEGSPIGDPFTVGEGELPRAFRPGRCELRADGSVAFHILLFWKDDERTEQRQIIALLKRSDDRWLIDNVEN
jgi:hypothetical protein